MKKNLIILSITLILFSLILTSYQTLTLPNLQGSYAVNYGRKTSAYQHLNIHYKANGEILFYLEGCAGVPGYNTGSIYDRLTFNKATGNYEYMPKDTTEDCNLAFVKKGNTIIITTLHGDCGFGAGIFADGAYQLKSNINPQYFTTRTNKNVYFDKTTPETLTDY